MNNLHFEFAKDLEGNKVNHRFVITFGKTISKMGKDIQPLLELDGIDLIQPVGRYSFEIVIARTFDADEVRSTIEKLAKDIQSDIVVPNKDIVLPS